MLIMTEIFKTKQVRYSWYAHNSCEVVDAINESSCNSEFGMVIQGSLELLRFFQSWKMLYLKRDYNRIAHELAQLAKFSGSSQQ